MSADESNPWEWQKKVYQNLELHLDAAIDKVANLTMDVELKRMENKWDEVYEQTHNQEVMQPQEVAVVAEKEYEYGADAFEEYLAKQGHTELMKESADLSLTQNDEKKR